jgi:hypothetical protein
MFDSDHPAGIPAADGTIPFATQLVTHNYDQLIRILRAAAIRGKHMMGESAPSRGLGSMMAFSEPIYAKHVGATMAVPADASISKGIWIHRSIRRPRGGGRANYENNGISGECPTPS